MRLDYQHALLSAVFLTSTMACQEVEEPATVLTQQQWKEVKQNVLTEAPTPQHKVGADFGGKIELIGFDVSPAQPVAGQEATFTWYWKAKSKMKKNWKIFIHFDSQAKPVRQGLDHHPVGEKYKTSMWKPGEIIKDVQTVTLRSDYPAGEAIPYIGFYNGNGVDARLDIVNDVPKTKDRRAIGPKLTVKNTGKTAPKAAAKPRYAVRPYASAGGAPVIDGKLDDPSWAVIPKLAIQPFGKGQNLETWAKITYDDEAMYIGAYLEDRHAWGDLKERDANTWTQEVIELFVDVNGDGEDYLELQVTPLNTVFDANFKKMLGRGEGSRDEQIDRARAWNMEGLETAVYVDGTVNDQASQDKFWTVEIKLPFKSMPGAGAAPKANATWSMNMYRFDRPKPKQSFAYAWSRAARGNFHRVDQFGELRFIGKKATDQPEQERKPDAK